MLRSSPGRLALLGAGILVVIVGAELGRRSVRLTFQERFTTQLHPRWFGAVARALGAVGCVAGNVKNAVLFRHAQMGNSCILRSRYYTGVFIL